MSALPPLSLYVHLPWCERKCPYCDFNSFEQRGTVPDDAYVGALLRDLDAEIAHLGTARIRPLISVFIGGGTPSLFSGPAIARLLDGIRRRIPLAHDCEITLEANPGSAEAARFDEYRAAGVTRLSVGVQSFRDPELRALGRVHSADDARRAVAAASNAGFASVNVDLMYGLPAGTDAGALDDLETALALEPSHLSWYQLTLEPGTAFYRKPPPLPDDDCVVGIERRGRALIASAGLERYEISGYARTGARCLHNLNYWRFGDYIGIGAGAHGKLTDDAGIERRSKRRNPRLYAETVGTPSVTESERLDDPAAIVVEFMMNALRLVDGVETTLLEATTGRPRREIAAARAEAERLGWLDPDPDRLRATPAGLGMLNRLVALF